MNQNQDITKNIQILDAILGVDARQWGKARFLPSAVRITQQMEPAGGFEIPVYPASYPNSGGDPVYDMNGAQVDANGKVSHYLHCVIDSYQSQANRMEPAFLCEELGKYVPQIDITVPRKKEADPSKAHESLSVFNVAHRVADFRLRLSDQKDSVKSWIKSFDDGNALPLIQNLPTSVLFGFWDSRDLGTKHARILMSRIDAKDVVPCQKHSIYSGMYSKSEFLSIVNHEGETDDKILSERGFTNAPGSGLGGVFVRGGITRTSLLSLTDIARLHCGNDTSITNAARRYIFCLGLLAEAFQREMGSYNLRSGCELVSMNEPMIELRGGKENTEFLALCQDQVALCALIEDAIKLLGIPTGVQNWKLTPESLKTEFASAQSKKEDKRNKANAKKAAKKKGDSSESAEDGASESNDADL
jgi:CRISPR-associated protein Csb1